MMSITMTGTITGRLVLLGLAVALLAGCVGSPAPSGWSGNSGRDRANAIPMSAGGDYEKRLGVDHVEPEQALRSGPVY
jgi:hypothetical protein